jgi:hypothetical protein
VISIVSEGSSLCLFESRLQPLPACRPGGRQRLELSLTIAPRFFLRGVRATRCRTRLRAGRGSGRGSVRAAVGAWWLNERLACSLTGWPKSVSSRGQQRRSEIVSLRWDVSTRTGSTELAEVVAQARCLRYLVAPFAAQTELRPTVSGRFRISRYVERVSRVAFPGSFRRIKTNPESNLLGS